MALYIYRAVSKDGKQIKGNIDAASLQNAKDQLLKRGLYIISVEASSETESSLPWYKNLFAKKVTAKDKILFTKQLAVLLKSGIPLLQAIELLTEQFEGKMRSILVSLKDGIKEGGSLAEGLKKYPKIFDNIYVQLVKAGEATGKLEVILERLTTYLERRQALQKKIKSALQYPLTQIVVVGLVVVFLLTYVVPQISQIFTQHGGALPLPTRILIAGSDFIRSYYIFILIILALIIGTIRYWLSTKEGAKTFDKIKLQLPLIKYFAKISAVVQFSRTLGMLLEGGVNLSDALDIVVDIIDNKVLADELSQARDKIIKQGKIAQFLKETNIFPPIAIYLINTGEQSGQLDTMLLTVAENYEVELSELTDSLTAKIEPVMMFVMAAIVGFIVLSIALPLTQMSNLAGV